MYPRILLEQTAGLFGIHGAHFGNHLYRMYASPVQACSGLSDVQCIPEDSATNRHRHPQTIDLQDYGACV